MEDAAGGNEDCEPTECDGGGGSKVGSAPEGGHRATSAEELVFSGGGWREAILKDLEEGTDGTIIQWNL